MNFNSLQFNRMAFRVISSSMQLPTDDRMATYTNLEPGKYTFKVLSSNNDGIWNATAVNCMWIAKKVKVPPSLLCCPWSIIKFRI